MALQPRKMAADERTVRNRAEMSITSGSNRKSLCRSKSAKRCSTAPIIRRNGASLRQQKSRRAASISWRERTPAMNGWKHTTIGRYSSRSIRSSRSRELKSGTGVKRRWNFRRNGFRSRSCILKNAAPEAGATSVLQCVMRCRKNPIQNLF